MIGRMGNNLFQIYTARSLNPETKIGLMGDKEYQVILDILPKMGKSEFESKYEFIDRQSVSKEIPEFIYGGHKYREIPYKDNFLIGGYYQSPKYLNKDLIYDEFDKIFASLDQDCILNKYGLIKGKFNFIGFRRGDFLYDYNKEMFDLCDGSWYKKAFELANFDPNYQIAILSDDIEWCRVNIKGNNIVFIDTNDCLEQMWIMSQAENAIIPNSTFSWWGAYLNKKGEVIVAPDVWVKHQDRSKNWTAKILCPEEWKIVL